MRRSTAVGGAFATLAMAVALTVTAGTANAAPLPVAPPSPSPAAVSVEIPEPEAPFPPNPRQGGGQTGTNGGTNGGTNTDGQAGTNGTDAPRTGAPAVPPEPTRGADDLQLESDRLEAGGWMGITAANFASGEQVQVVIYSAPVVVGSFAADADGILRARFQLPKDLRPGVHTVEATGWTSARVANKTFVVVTGPLAGGTVPLTGWLLGVLGALVAAAVATLVYFRRSIGGWLSPPVPSAPGTSS